MLIAALAVVAALAFVLGLGALCLWALKRWGKLSLRSRARVAVEVVERVSLGPKTGLAVVRVGERVMALSVGDGGVRLLFELDDADRQRVLASSQVAMPLELSRNAMSFEHEGVPAPVAVRSAHTPIGPVFSATEAREIPAFLTASLRTQRGLPLSYGPPAPRASAAAERDFRKMLGGALSNATRLAVFTGIIVLATTAIAPLGAQAAPPVTPPVTTQPSPVAGAKLATPIPATAVTPAATASAPAAPTVPSFVRPSISRAGAPSTSAPVSPRTGNGASVTTGGAASRRPMSQVQVDSALGAAKNPRAVAASTAPVGEDAVMRMMPQVDLQLGDAKDGGLRLNGTVGIVVMMGLLTLLPTLLLMMTGFTRILIVLHFLKQAMGTQSAPPAQLLAAMALLLTGFVMAPTLNEVNSKAITPWLDGRITQVEMMKTGVVPLREFMLRQTRESDLKTFVEMSRLPRPNTAADVPLHVLMSAFVASELRTAFQIGFAIYLPFIIIDTVVASVLMSMGMFMLPPAMISLPFKLLLFVLVDGWSLTISSLVQSFK